MGPTWDSRGDRGEGERPTKRCGGKGASMGTVMQCEITAIVFLIKSLTTLEDVDTACGIFHLLRQWEAATYADLCKEGTVECGRYKLKLIFGEETFFGQIEDREVVVILDSAFRKSFTIPDYDDWPTDIPENVNPGDYGRPIRSEKARGVTDESGIGDPRAFEPYIRDWKTILPLLHFERRSDRP